MAKRTSSVEIEEYATKIVGDDLGVVFGRFGFRHVLFKIVINEHEIDEIDAETRRSLLEEFRDTVRIRPDAYAIVETEKAIICLEVEHKSLLTEEAMFKYGDAWDYVDTECGDWELFLIITGRHGNWRQLPLIRKSHESYLGKISDEDHEFHKYVLNQKERNIKQVLANRMSKQNRVCFERGQMSCLCDVCEYGDYRIQKEIG